MSPSPTVNTTYNIDTSVRLSDHPVGQKPVQWPDSGPTGLPADAMLNSHPQYN